MATSTFTQLLSSYVCLSDKDPFSSFQVQARLLTTSSFYASLLQVTAGAMSLTLRLQLVSQAPRLMIRSTSMYVCTPLAMAALPASLSARPFLSTLSLAGLGQYTHRGLRRWLLKIFLFPENLP